MLDGGELLHFVLEADFAPSRSLVSKSCPKYFLYPSLNHFVPSNLFSIPYLSVFLGLTFSHPASMRPKPLTSSV
jgi:hypothetical protein